MLLRLVICNIYFRITYFFKKISTILFINLQNFIMNSKSTIKELKVIITNNNKFIKPTLVLLNKKHTKLN